MKTIALHSYKGGTGKTTLISNLAAIYAKSGFNVVLLDFDLYAPSLSSYFKKKPKTFATTYVKAKQLPMTIYFFLANLVLANHYLHKY